MSHSDDSEITPFPEITRLFLEPSNPTHRQYEALRAYFVEGLPSTEAAERFGYTPGSFRVLCHSFRQDPRRQFFISRKEGTRRSPKKDRLRQQIVALRKNNLSVYDIVHALEQDDVHRSPNAVWRILEQEGFARLPRRNDEERPSRPGPDTAAVADVRCLDLSPRTIHTRFGGLFLFVPYLAQLSFDSVINGVGLPGSRMIPAKHAMLALLGLKLFGNARKSHVMSSVFDEGLALFAGLNVIPKRSFLTEYSCRIDPRCYPKLMQRWFDAAGLLGLQRGVSFDLDFHTIPFHGEDALVERHYIAKRSRKQKGILAFLARDADQRVFCYANGSIRKEDQCDEILRFVDFWKKRTGKLPEELVFDSKLTTYKNLNRLNAMKIPFITLRRRTKKMLAAIYSLPRSAWRRVELKRVTRVYRTPRVIDRKISLTDYEGPIREFVITDLGHEQPTLLLTNQLKRSKVDLIERYASRMLIENAIEDGIDFFHMDALSSAVAMKVDCDLQLTLMASSLYRLLGAQIGNGYAHAKARHIFRDLIDATASINISAGHVDVHFQKRAHNPLLVAGGFDKTQVVVPWLGGKRLSFHFG